MYLPHIPRENKVVNYYLSEYMLSVMAFRLFYIFRSYFNYSEYTDPYSKKLCQQYGFNANLRFAFKAKMEKEPSKTVFFITTLMVIFYAYILRIFELPYFRILDQSNDLYRAMDDHFTAVYISIVTMTTVGYGDIAPCTTPGRVVAIQIALTGSFLMAMVLETVTQQT